MASQANPILVVDDDAALLSVLEAGLKLQDDYDVTAVMSAEDALDLIRNRSLDLVVTDYSLEHPSINGLAILREARRQNPPPLVIMITAFASLQITLESIHLGAYDFLTKPFQIDELLLVVRNAIEFIRLQRENGRLRQQVGQLIDRLDGISRRHTEWLGRLRRLDGDPTAPTAAEDNGLLAISDAPTQELRRRRMGDQIAHYVRLGESLGHELKLERERIESMFLPNVTEQAAYQGARTHQAPPGADGITREPVRWREG